MAKDIRAGRAFIELLLRDKVGGALLGVQRKLDGFARGVASVGGRLAIGAGLLGAPLAGAAAHFANYAGAVDDVAQRTGAAPRAVQTLGYAAQLTGAEFGDVEPALRKWQQNLAAAAESAGPARDKFEALGLDAGKLANVGIDEQFGAIAEALSKLSGAERTAAAMELLGKSGTKLIPMLSGGAEGLEQFRREAERLGVVLSDEAIAAGAELGDQLDKLRIVISALVLNIGAALSPELIELGRVLVGTVGGVNRWIQANPEMARGLAMATIATGGASAAMFLLAGGIKLAAFSLGPLAIGARGAAIAMNLLTGATVAGQVAAVAMIGGLAGVARGLVTAATGAALLAAVGPARVLGSVAGSAVAATSSLYRLGQASAALTFTSMRTGAAAAMSLLAGVARAEAALVSFLRTILFTTFNLYDMSRAGLRSAAVFATSTYRAAAAQLRSLWIGAQAAAGGLWNVARAGTVAAAASVRAGAAAAVAGVASLASWQLLAGLLVAGGVAWLVYSGAAEQALAGIAYGAGYAGETLRGSFERAGPIVLGLFRSWGSTFAGVWAGMRDALAAGDLGAAAGVAFAGLKLAGVQALAALEAMFGKSISGIARLIAAGQWGRALQIVGAELGLSWRETTNELSGLWGEFWTGAVVSIDQGATAIRNAWGDLIAWISKTLLAAWQAIDSAYSRVASLVGATSSGGGLDFEAARASIDDDNARAAAERNKAADERAAARGAALSRQQAELDEERRRVAELRQTLRAGAAGGTNSLDDALLIAQINLEKARADAAAKRKALEDAMKTDKQEEDPASELVARGDRVTQTFSAAAAVLLGAGGGLDKRIEANTARTARAVEKIAGWGPPVSPTFS